MGDYVLNEGENLREILDEINKNPPQCRLCKQVYNPGDGNAFSFSEGVHILCKEKAGYKRWEAIPRGEK